MTDGRYCRIKTKFWTDEKIRSLSDDAKLLALYLLSSPHTNMIGCYILPKLYACDDLGWELERFEKAFQELLRNGFVKYDEKTRLLLLPNYLKHNPIENENQAKAAAKIVAELPRSYLLQDLKRFIEQLDKHFLKPLLEQLLQHLPKEFCKQFEEPVTVTVTVTESVTVTEEIENNYSLKGVVNNSPDGDGEANASPPTLQSPEVETSTLVELPEEDVDCIKPNEVVRLWNEECGDVLPKVVKITEERRRKIKSRVASSPERRSPEWWRSYFRAIRASPFLCGDNDRGWRANFDWAVRSETVIARVLEGLYQSRKKIPRAFASLMEWAQEEGVEH